MKELKRQAQLDRQLCQRSLYYLCKEVLGYHDLTPHIHGDFCFFLTHPKFGRFRQATLPRSWFKTWVGTIGKSIWLTLPDEEGLYSDIYPYKGPDVRILIASNVIDNAAKMVHKVKAEWENNERLKAAFPDLLPDYNKTRWSDHAAEVRRSIKATEATYTAVGVGGSVISQHFDHLLEDDLIYAKKDDFTGQELMPTQEDIDNAIGWHKLAFSLLSDPGRGAIDNIGTRWAPQDLVHYIRTQEKQYQCFEISAEDAKTGEPVWPQRYSAEVLSQIRATQGHRIYECFPAEAPVLMADWVYKPISDISVGDEVVGFVQGTSNSQARLVKATVNLLERHTKEVVKVTLENGDVIRCTPDHPWYTGRCDRTHKPYLPAHVGGSLLSVHTHKCPTAEELLDYRYLAGLLDGEGACNHGSIAIGQSKVANPEVYAGIEGVLNRLNIPYKISKVNPYDVHVLRNREVRRGLGESFVIAGGREIKIDILQFGRPSKHRAIANTIWDRPHNPIKARHKVVAIEPDGIETVYAIGTTSGNYVAYGYATKNTQYLNRPSAAEDIVFKPAYVSLHGSLSEFPPGMEYKTIVDLASWGDSKGLANNVILTGAKDSKNHLWIARIDAGRFNPTEVIELFFSHAQQFHSKIYVEEIQYQRAIRHFARKEMERTGKSYPIEQLKYDGRKNAKDLRIRALEPVVNNGFLHILSHMRSMLEELEFYPRSRTVDILDCAGWLFRVARAIHREEPNVLRDPFSIDEVEKELKSNSSSGLPFSYQLKSWEDAGYGR